MGIDDRLKRLGRLQGGDPGIFALAVHSFIEGELRRRYGLPYEEEPSFNALSDRLIEDAGDASRRFLANLKAAHHAVNEVRHEFKALEADHAVMAAAHLYTFCYFIDETDRPELRAIKRELDETWIRPESRGELIAGNQALQMELQKVLAEKGSLSDQLTELEEREEERERVDEHIHSLENRIRRLLKDKDRNEKKIKELRDERFDLKEQRRSLERRTRDLEEYLHVMRTMTSYTRTRRDYERLVLRLSARQEEALGRIDLSDDVLIAGGPGTGKTLVLLKAIEKSPKESRVALLTYTNSLAKYGRYLTGLLESGVRRIMTIHHFLLERIREGGENFEVLTGKDEGLLIGVCEPYADSSLSAKEIHDEIVHVLWAFGYTRQRYVVDLVPRVGMEKDLDEGMRSRVWAAKESVEAFIEETGRLPFAYFPIRALKVADEHPVTIFDHLFVDEAQDVTVMTLAALKRFALKSIILAGDGEQAIYQPGFSFARVSDHQVVVLRENFRSTWQIHRLAERFERRSGEERSGALRDGPNPELHRGRDESDLRRLVVERAMLFIRQLEYEEENVCIMCPSSSCYRGLEEALEEAGIRSVRINDERFSFGEEYRGHLRLSTLHSAKGLDIPVVLLHLPFLPREHEAYDEEVNAELARKLLYVAMTRAIDHLNVFTLADPKEEVIRDLVAAF
ncbi:MAG: AAA family ATPase [Spirochaetales bacterium]|nr:AAA family ATPase [Spirochaetales bacterium]